MKSNFKAEAHVIDRMMYLFEESSVERLAEQDPGFANYVDQLYAKLGHQSTVLHRRSLI